MHDSTNANIAENDNLRDEYSILYEDDVEKDIRWASIALGRKPDVGGQLLYNSSLLFLSKMLRAYTRSYVPKSSQSLAVETMMSMSSYQLINQNVLIRTVQVYG